jgi:hypothetical protein
MDAALSAGRIDEKNINADNMLANKYPYFSTSIYAIVT